MRFRSFFQKRFVLAVTLFIVESSLVLAWNYETMGKTGFNRIAADSSGQNLIASVFRGGVWQSINGGLSWEPLNNRFHEEEHYTGVHKILNGGKSDTMLVHVSALDGYKHYYTLDDGVNWLRLFRPDPEWCTSEDQMVIDRQNSSTWYLMTPNNIHKTINAGLTWDSWNYDTWAPKYGFKQDIFDDSTFYYNGNYCWISDSSQYRGGLVKSSDNCLTWDHYNPLINFGEDYDLNGVFVLSFCQMSNGDFIASYIMFELPEVEVGPFVIVDSTGNSLGSYGFELPSGFRAEKIVEDVEIAGRLYAFSSPFHGFFISNNYGRSWEACDRAGFPEGWHRISDVYQNELSGDLYVAIESAGLYKSMDNGGSWARIPDTQLGCPGRQFIFEDHVIISDFDNINLWKQDPEIGVWSKIVGRPEVSDETLIIDSVVHYANQDTIVASFPCHDTTGEEPSEYRFCHSYNGGEDWTEIQYNSSTLQYHSASTYIDEDICRIAMHNHFGDTLAFSYDLGFSWTNIPLFSGQSVRSEIEQSEDKIYLGFEEDIYYYDIENDTTVGMNCPGEDLGSAIQMEFFNDSLYISLGEHGFLFYDGIDWENRTVPPMGGSDWGFAIIQSDPPLFIVACQSQLGLYTSLDYGQSWEYTTIEHEYEQQNGMIYAPLYDRYRHRFWLSTGIGSLWIDADELIDAVSVGEPIVMHPAELKVISSYPNPFNASTRITYNVTKPGDIKLRLYDITGRLVKECLKEYKTAGKHEYHLDATSMPSGTYFMRLDMDYQAYVEKITLVK